MSNPRKFSEKIALHNQKQAEETAAFEQIMREVSGATRTPTTINHHQPSYQTQHLYINPLGAYRGGSLPNVNQISNNAIDLQNALENLETMKQGHNYIQHDRNRHMSHRNRVAHHERRRDASPYEPANYLSPPPDTSWRRTNSDSALHQSAMTPIENSPLGSINDLYFSTLCANNDIINNHRYNENGADNNSLLSDRLYWDDKQTLQSPSSPHRPKSCEVPGINIYPSQEESVPAGSPTNHIPISNSTGSLPDLTNLHFPSPLATPIDSEDQTCYSMDTTVQGSQNALTAPSIISHNNHHNQQQLGNSVIQTETSSHTIPNGIHNISSSPHRCNASRLSNLIIQNDKVSSHAPSDSSTVIKFDKNRVIQPPKIIVEQYSVPKQDNLSQFGMYRDETSTYSGMQGISGSLYQGRSSSPGGNSTCSAPTSPVSPSSSPGLDTYKSTTQSNYFPTQQQTQQQTNALQHQFENFNMVRNISAVVDENCVQFNEERFCLDFQDHSTTSNSLNNGVYINTASMGLDNSQCRDPVITISENSSYYHSSHSPISPHQPTYNNTNSMINRLNPSELQTPTNVPSIILTAPVSEDAQLLRQDLGNAMAGSFESDLFTSTEDLQADLGHIDFDGLQMLSDSDIPIDPATEEAFRNERL